MMTEEIVVESEEQEKATPDVGRYVWTRGDNTAGTRRGDRLELDYKTGRVSIRRTLHVLPTVVANWIGRGLLRRDQTAVEECE